MHIDRDNVIAISAPPSYVVGADDDDDDDNNNHINIDMR